MDEDERDNDREGARLAALAPGSPLGPPDSTLVSLSDVSATEGDLDLELSLSRDGGERFPAEALDASPLEKEIFREHTRFFGMFFKTMRMERVFLDGYARLHKNLVYAGYLVMLLVSILVPLQWFVLKLYEYNSVCPEGYENFCRPNGEQT